MTQSDIKRLSTLHEKLKDTLQQYGSIGFVKVLTELNHEYANAVMDIQNGAGLINRPEEEDAEKVLSSLRENYILTPRDYEKRLYFQKIFIELIDRVEEIDHFLGLSLKQENAL